MVHRTKTTSPIARSGAPSPEPKARHGGDDESVKDEKCKLDQGTDIADQFLDDLLVSSPHLRQFLKPQIQQDVLDTVKATQTESNRTGCLSEQGPLAQSPHDFAQTKPLLPESPPVSDLNSPSGTSEHSDSPSGCTPRSKPVLLEPPSSEVEAKGREGYSVIAPEIGTPSPRKPKQIWFGRTGHPRRRDRSQGWW